MKVRYSSSSLFLPSCSIDPPISYCHSKISQILGYSAHLFFPNSLFWTWSCYWLRTRYHVLFLLSSSQTQLSLPEEHCWVTHPTQRTCCWFGEQCSKYHRLLVSFQHGLGEPWYPRSAARCPWLWQRCRQSWHLSSHWSHVCSFQCAQAFLKMLEKWCFNAARNCSAGSQIR